jgi:hypothetical protein
MDASTSLAERPNVSQAVFVSVVTKTSLMDVNFCSIQRLWFDQVHFHSVDSSGVLRDMIDRRIELMDLVLMFWALCVVNAPIRVRKTM